MLGCFDRNVGWSTSLEKIYMEKSLLQDTKSKLTAHLNREKGCFEILATGVKCKIIKNLHKQGKKSYHGLYLTLELPKKNKFLDHRSLSLNI